MFKARVDELAEALLHVDLAAIAANHDDVVFTVRLSREFLRKNHAFLAAVSDFASGADLPRREIPPAESRAPTSPSPHRKRSIAASLAFGLAVTCFLIGWMLPTAPFIHGATATEAAQLSPR